MNNTKRPTNPTSSSAKSQSQSDQDAAFDAASNTEINTKLDLARQFIDMGDPESARHMLEEVFGEGDGAQQIEAKRLLDSLP